MDNQQRVVRDKKRGRNSPDMIMNRKQSIAVDCCQEDTLPTHNSFEGLEKMSEDANISTEPAKEAKLPPIFISKLNDLSLTIASTIAQSNR